MSRCTRSALIFGLLAFCCLAPHVAQAQTRDPSLGHAAPAIEEPTSTLRTATDATTRLWQRILTWSTRRSSDQRWRALYSRPSAAPAAAPAKTAAR